MQDYICCVCRLPFKRFSSQVRNNSPTCSKKCQAEKFKETLKGDNNPNYKNGIHCEKSICGCGKEKDYRAAECSICAGKSYPKDESSVITDAIIKEEIKKCKTFSEVAKKLKVSRKRVALLVENENINISHFKHCNFRPYTQEKILCLGTKRINSTVKKFIINNNLIKYECSECGQGNIWNGKPLILELDHKNGNPLDNRLDNLRFLCSNCHSQTDTNKGKNARKHE